MGQVPFHARVDVGGLWAGGVPAGQGADSPRAERGRAAGHRSTGGATWSLVQDAVSVGAPAAFALAALSGAVCATAFPPLSWSMAAWLGLVPLLVACAALPPRRAALAGMGWAASMGAGVAWCLPGMLSRYFGLFAASAWLAAMAIVGLQGLYVAGYAAWASWLVRRRAASSLLLAAGWLVCEFARAHGGLGTP